MALGTSRVQQPQCGSMITEYWSAAFGAKVRN